MQSIKRASQVKKMVAAAAVTSALAFGFASGGTSLAADCGEADTRDPWCEESYPISVPPVTHPPAEEKPLPETGSDATGLWIKIGGGTVLAGGLLVAATARRRNEEESALAS